MQPPPIKNVLLLLSLYPFHVSRPYRPLPRHWKSNQKASAKPKTLGEQIKKHRLELCWLQRDARIVEYLGYDPFKILVR